MRFPFGAPRTRSRTSTSSGGPRRTSAPIDDCYEHHDRLVVGRLGEEFVPANERRLVLPNGGRLPEDTVVCGRGEVFDVFVGLDWYRLDLDHLV